MKRMSSTGTSTGLIPVRDMPDSKLLEQLILSDPVNGWETAWKGNITPWDVGKIQPPLKDLIESHRLPLPNTGRALVPGAGRAYDAIFLANTLEYETVAVDIAPTAIEAAKKVVDSSPNGSRVTLIEADFFKYTVPTENERFDIVYDYTFFVSMPHDLRLAWGSQMRTLVKPGGYVVTLMWPLGLDKDSKGPPYYFDFQDYVDALGGGWDVVINEIPTISSNERHQGKERLVVWKKL